MYLKPIQMIVYVFRTVYLSSWMESGDYQTPVPGKNKSPTQNFFSEVSLKLYDIKFPYWLAL